MHRYSALLVGCLAAIPCIAQEAQLPSSDPSQGQLTETAAVDKAEQHALRVRGMKAAVADIENNRPWILNELRSRAGASGQSCSLQSTLARELNIPADNGFSFDPQLPRPSILDQDTFALMIPLAAIRGYNDIMWAEIEHRFGAGTRKQIESLAAEPRGMEELPWQRGARGRDRLILLAPESGRTSP
jgi:hypothetical protein